MNDTMQMCCNLQPFLNILRIVIKLIQYSVPLLLLVLGTIDMVKVVTSGDDKVAKESSTTFMKRLIYAALIFVVPFLLKLILNIVNNYIIKDSENNINSVSWFSCFNYAMNNELKSVCSSYEDIYTRK